MQLQASNRQLFQDPELRLRRVKEGVTLDEVKGALKDNGRDEIVLHSNNDLMVIDAVRLRYEDDSFVKTGDSVELAGVTGRVVATDYDAGKSPLPRAVGVGLGIALTGIAIGGPAALVGMWTGFILGEMLRDPKNDDSKLSQITQTLGESETGNHQILARDIRFWASRSGSNPSEP